MSTTIENTRNADMEINNTLLNDEWIIEEIKTRNKNF